MTSAVPVSGHTFAITGGLSLLGVQLSKTLLERGARRSVLVDNLAFHNPQRLPIADDLRVDLVQADVRDADALISAVDGLDGLFHTAAFVTIPMAADPMLGLDVNIRGTETRLRAAIRAGIRKVIVSSSVAIYGQANEDPITEVTPFHSSSLQPVARLYGASKVITEALCERAHVDSDLAFACLRYSSLYGGMQAGRGLNALHLWEAFEAMRRSRPPTLQADPAQVHDYIHANDAARANVAAMESSISRGAYTIASGQPVSLKEATSILAQVAGFQGVVAFAATALRLRYATVESLNYDISLAAQHLDWTPQISLREGLERLVRDAGGRIQTFKRETVGHSADAEASLDAPSHAVQTEPGRGT